MLNTTPPSVVRLLVQLNLYTLKRAFNDGVTIGNIGYTMESGDGAVRTGAADLIAYGRPTFTNPDLPEKFAAGLPLLPNNEMKYWYGGGAEGYTEHPYLTSA